MPNGSPPGKGWDRFDRAVLAAAVLCSVVMVAVAFAQVVFRYVLQAPLIWSEEFARYAFVWATNFAAAAGMRSGSHVAIDLCVARLGRASRRAVDAAARTIAVVFLAVIGTNGIRLALLTFGQTSPIMGFPMGYMHLAVPLGCGLMIINLLRDLFAPAGEARPAPGMLE